MIGRVERPPAVGARGWIVVSVIVASGLAAWHLELRPSELAHLVGSESLREFFAAALTPSLGYEDPAVPADVPPLLAVAGRAAWNTVVYALAAMSLSIVAGVVLGVCGSSAWWPSSPRPGGARRWALRALQVVARTVSGLLRSIHELLWAVLFLATFGLDPLSAVLAVALPFGGVVGKLFAELLDEAPRDAARALAERGASSFQVLCFGLVPRALPDLLGYAFYRFECALRSTAVLGFFGLQTLGFHIRSSFDEGLYRQGWTYLYALIAVILVTDAWSGAIRRRLAR